MLSNCYNCLFLTCVRQLNFIIKMMKKHDLLDKHSSTCSVDVRRFVFTINFFVFQLIVLDQHQWFPVGPFNPRLLSGVAYVTLVSNRDKFLISCFSN